MQVGIKNFNINMDVKSAGIEFEVKSPDGKKRYGDCYLTMSGLIWCRGKTTKAKGIKISWNEFMQIMESKESKASAVKASKE
jgi:hypothetical protein